MILSGVSGQLGTLEKEAVEQQLKGVSSILDTAQKDFANLATTSSAYRIRRSKFGRRGLEVILKELVDKSEIRSQL